MKTNPEVRGAPRASTSRSLGTVLKKDFNKHWFAYLLAIPVVVWYIVFCYGPIWGVLIAFKDFKPLLGFAQ
ncbi:sugar ABC transporter permease, partial [Paenibacillus septentrionalis]